jgi:serine/threonine protein kinase
LLRFPQNARGARIFLLAFEECALGATLPAVTRAAEDAIETIGNYQIERSLAHGSMGHVYVARHTLTYTKVALKVLRSDLEADTQAQERFLREVRAAAQIGHDGIVKVYDAGRSSDGQLYLAMELLSGETLEERIEREQGDRLSSMDWLMCVLEPLAAAHGQGIVHRDLKPANVFIARATDGSEQIKLLDFGLARDTSQKSGTETGIALGTPYYMSPEQALRPKLVGPASDVWSCGVMMYEVLSGQMPFDGETLHAVVLNATSEPHVPLREHEPSLDLALCALVEACLSKDPAKRPADAGELLVRLHPLLSEPSLRDGLSQPLAARLTIPKESISTARMPFADTAISMPPRLYESETRYQPKRSSRGLWISALSLLLLAAGSLVLALARAGGESSPRTGQKVAAPAGGAASPVTADGNKTGQAAANTARETGQAAANPARETGQTVAPVRAEQTAARAPAPQPMAAKAPLVHPVAPAGKAPPSQAEPPPSAADVAPASQADPASEARPGADEPGPTPPPSAAAGPSDPNGSPPSAAGPSETAPVEPPAHASEPSMPAEPPPSIDLPPPEPADPAPEP